jgi:hypothetical protein
MLTSVDAAAPAGELSVDERQLLQARLRAAGGQFVEALALNDVVMQKHDTGRTLDFETRVDGRFVNSHGGDGIIVASATGSTAYALSCGGPIIEPHLPVLVMAPICAHTLSDRPIVVSSAAVIEVALLARSDTQAHVTCDGVVLGNSAPRTASRCVPPRSACGCCTRAVMITTSCCAPSFTWGRGDLWSAERTMLTYLQIRDFAIIDAVELELRPGLTRAHRGDRAPASRSWSMPCSCWPATVRVREVVRHGAERAEVSGTFDLARAPRAARGSRNSR